MSLGQGNLLHDRYRIIEILGRGGMGAVYRAVDERLGVDVAVKENLFTTEDYARQFRMEAVILAGIRHPNLPRVTDHFVLDGMGQYLVMDYIEGNDLRQRLEREGTLPEAEAMRIGAAVCDALSYLHSRKPPILHRDIKLGNIKLTSDGGVFLVDFGLAKMGWENEQTMTGARAMTPGYSPPEQYGSARTDARSDIYSLGATLYAAITGVVPEDSLMRAMDGLDLTPLRSHAPTISKRLSNVIEKAMETNPSRRYQTAEEFKGAILGTNQPTLVLENEAGEAQPADPSQEKTRRKAGCFTRFIAFLLTLTVLLAAIGGILWYTPAYQHLLSPYLAVLFTSTPAPTATATTFAATPEPASPTLAPLTVTSSPAFTRTLIGTPIRLPATSTPTATEAPASPVPEVVTPTASPTETATPDGGSGEIGFASSKNSISQIYLINTDGSNLRQLTDNDKGACNFDWSPDGKQLVYVSPCATKSNQYTNSGLYLFDIAANTIKPLLEKSQGEFDPAWSPDGTKIAFTSFRDQAWQIYIADLTTQPAQVTQLTFPDTASQAQARYPAWSPDGSQIAYSLRKLGQFQIWTMNADGSNQTRLFLPANGISDLLPAWSPDNTFILFSESNFDNSAPAGLMRFNFGMKSPEKLPAVPLPVQDVSFSPDGASIVYETTDTNGPNIYIFNLLRNERLPLTTGSDGVINFDPVWRP